MNIKCIDHYGNVHTIESGKFVFRMGVYGILRQNDTILFVKSKWAKILEFPGGGVEINETIPNALTREIKDETGLEVEPGKFLTLK
jgi:ADP-ribose pyrophosphatase YjhB (NUDIX family)